MSQQITILKQREAVDRLQNEFRKNMLQYSNQKELLIYQLSRLRYESGSSRASSATSCRSRSSQKQMEKCHQKIINVGEKRTFLSPVNGWSSGSLESPAHSKLPQIQSDRSPGRKGSQMSNSYEYGYLPQINDSSQKRRNYDNEADTPTDRKTKRNDVLKKVHFNKSVTADKYSKEMRKSLPELSSCENSNDGNSPGRAGSETPRRSKMKYVSTPTRLPAIKEKSETKQRPKRKVPLNLDPEQAIEKTKQWKAVYVNLTDPEKRSQALADILYAVRLTKHETEKRLGISKDSVNAGAFNQSRTTQYKGRLIGNEESGGRVNQFGSPRDKAPALLKPLRKTDNLRGYLQKMTNVRFQKAM